MHALTLIQIAGSAIAVMSTAVFVATLAVVGAALARNWLLFRAWGIAAVVAIAGLVLTLGLLLCAVKSLDTDQAAQKATVLARGISQGMSVSYVLLALGLVAISIRWIAQRRTRKRQ